MAYGILVPSLIAAMNIDSLNRSVRSATAIENGMVFSLLTKSTVAGEEEVFVATVPTTGTGTGLAHLWMAMGDEIVLTSSKYKGIDPDVRNFRNEIGQVFSAYKPQLGDIITVSADALAGTFISGTTTHVNATTTNWQLVWGNSQTASVLSYKLLRVVYFSLATGGINSQRITAYQLECVGIA